MKKLLLAFSLLLFMGSSAFAGTVTIGWASDSLGSPCVYPQRIGFIIGGTASGYTQNDSLDVFVAFGDGQDTTFKISIFNGTNWGAWAEHKYLLPGLYTVQYVVTAPDLASDTLTVPNEVIIGSSCGNISGKLYLDNNSDCSFNTGDVALTNRTVKLKLGSQVVSYAITDSAGDYEFTAVAGLSYTVETSNAILNTVCPASGVHNVSSLPAANLDFAMTCPTSQFDVESKYTGGFIVPGVERSVYFRVQNNMCAPATGVSALTLGPQVTYVPSPSSYYTAPDSVVGSTLYFSYSNLGINGQLDIRVKLKGDTTLTVNDTVCMSMSSTPTIGDANAANNTINPCVEVRTSYDPNMKTVYPSGVGASGDIKPNQTMLYTVHFQNTGNFMATNIYILDTIDDQVLDMNTLEVLEFSHQMELRVIDNNLLKFSFNNIMLPDSNSNEPESHGFVSFTIDQKAALPEGTKIENTAGIFFDYNPPIITNTATNTINRFVSIEEFGRTEVSLVQAYPNPTAGKLTLKPELGIKEASAILFDLNGKKLMDISITDETTVDLSQLPSGIYLLNISGDAGTQQKRIVVQ